MYQHVVESHTLQGIAGGAEGGPSSSGDESARVSGSGARGVAARAAAGAATALQPSGGGSTGKSSTATKGKGKRKAATSSTHEQPGKRAAGRKAMRRPKPATEEEESKADEKAYKRSLKTMERFAARQEKDGEAFARREITDWRIRRSVNAPPTEKRLTMRPCACGKVYLMFPFVFWMLPFKPGAVMMSMNAPLVLSTRPSAMLAPS